MLKCVLPGKQVPKLGMPCSENSKKCKEVVMKKIFNLIKKPIQWLKKKPILSTELLVIFVTAALIYISFWRYYDITGDSYDVSATYDVTWERDTQLYKQERKEYVLKNTPFTAGAVATVGFMQAVAVFLIVLQKKKRISMNEIDKARDLFVNALAHEMKTPAAVIINSTECIREGVRPDKKEIYRNNISKEAEHINNLVDSMLTYTKVIDKDYKPTRKEICVNEIAKTVFNRFEILTENTNIEMSMVENGKLIIYGDEQLINTVVDNYISNATKNCKENGKVIVTLDEESFSVFNEGGHIAEDELTKIWEPLYKADKARKEAGESSGMGLAICAGILKLHGFAYSSKNVEGGVEFTFTK